MIEKSRFISKSEPYLSPYKLNVRNLSSRVIWKDLKTFFRKWVEVTHADCNDRYVGEGEVYFKTREDMDYAYRKIDGEILNVFYSKFLLQDLADIFAPIAETMCFFAYSLNVLRVAKSKISLTY